MNKSMPQAVGSSSFTAFRKGLKPWYVQSVLPRIEHTLGCLVRLSQFLFCFFVFVQVSHLIGMWISSHSGPVVGAYIVFPGIDFNTQYMVKGLLPGLVLMFCLFPLWRMVETICRVGDRTILNENIENKVLKMIEPFSDTVSPISRPCHAFELATAEEQFEKIYGIKLPVPYKIILSLSNGLKYRSLTVWPVTLSTPFDETIFEVNSRLRTSYLKDLVYFGFAGGYFFAYSRVARVFCKIHNSEMLNIEHYDDADQMFIAMLEQA